MTKPIDDITPEEMANRVIYSTLRPAVRLARVFDIPLRDLKQWLAIAYLQELKRKGHTQNECAEHLDVSRRTIIGLSKQLRENFFNPERTEGLTRRILVMLWAEPITEGRLIQSLEREHSESDVRAALLALEAEEKIVRDESNVTVVYTLNTSTFRMIKNNWIARIDALNNQVTQLADTVYSRFFTQSDSAFVRNVGLSIRPEDRVKLEQFYQDVIFPKLIEFDSVAEDDPNAEYIDFSLSWVTHDFIDSLESDSKTKKDK